MTLSGLWQTVTELRGILPVDVPARAAGCRSEVVSWRQPLRTSRPHDPRPWASARTGTDPWWVDAGEEEADGFWVGLDAGGRAVLTEDRRSWRPGPPETSVWEWADEHIDVLTATGARRHLLEDGRVILVVDVRGEDVRAERWSWTGGVPVRGARCALQEDYLLLETYAVEVDDDGRLVRLLRTGRGEDADAGTVTERAVLDGLDRAAGLEPEQLMYDARIHRRELDLVSRADLLDWLPAALEDAVVASVAASGVVEPFVVMVHEGERFRPGVRVGGARFRDRMVALSPGHDAALQLHKADGTEGATLALVDFMTEDAARACRQIDTMLTAARSPARMLEEQQLLTALGEDLSSRLNRHVWSGVAEPFLALVSIGDHEHAHDRFARARATADPRLVGAFQESIRSRAERGTLDPAARADRTVLAGVLRDHGLPERLAHDVAETGLQLVADESGQARSRLGGPALLPPGHDWPYAGQRPLTFLAALDLGELPHRGPLPDAGWLLFFADLEDAEDSEDGFCDVSGNADDDPARVLHVPAGVELLAAEAPAGMQVVLSHRPVRFQPQLVLPDGYKAGEELGLDPALADAYERIAGWLRYGDRRPDEDGGEEWDEEDWDDDDDDSEFGVTGEGGGETEFIHMEWGAAGEDDGSDAERGSLVQIFGTVDEDDPAWETGEDDGPSEDHWVLGPLTGVQGHAPEPGSVLLLHLSWDDALGFTWADGGNLQFRIPEAALATGDWSAVEVFGDSS